MILVVVLKLSTEVIWFYLEYVPHIYYLKCNVYVAKKHVIHEYHDFPQESGSISRSPVFPLDSSKNSSRLPRRSRMRARAV